MKPCVVYKLGGSLLDLPDLAVRLRRVWAEKTDSDVLLVVGGGSAVDVVRDWDRNLQLGSETSHWLAIDALDLSAKLLEHLVPELLLVRSLGQMRSAHAAGRPALLCIKCFVKWLETQPNPLPHSWDVTSDSISAAVTQAWQAEELILLKSRDLPERLPTETLEGLVTAEAVDPCFPRAAAEVERISWINFRSDRLERQIVRSMNAE
ncbi:MAG: putative aspartokinase uridylate kinaselike protein [Planctomycetaceae bacterium]|nr:putative aspartokinase uridylate kinaselike protein [Planctomycetaceae bacterium]